MLNLERVSAFRPHRRRRRSLACPADVPLTPCRSTNRPPFFSHPKRHPIDRTAKPLWSAATGTTVAADDEREEVELAAAETDREGGAPSVASYSCDPEAQLLRMGARKWGTSSHGSCAAWSPTSLMDGRPVSPSPVCSPHVKSPPVGAAVAGGGARKSRVECRVFKSPEPTLSDDVFYSQVSTDLHSSAPRFQSSSGIHARRSTSRLETGSAGNRRRSNARASKSRKSFAATPSSPLYAKPGRRSGFSGILEQEKEGYCGVRRSVTLAGAPRFSTCSRREARNSCSDDDGGKLSVLGEEDEEQEERGWRKRNQLILGGRQSIRRKSHHRHHAYSPSADCTAESGFGDDGVPNTWDDGRVGAEPPRMSAAVRQGGRAKLLEWKETKTREVLDKLKTKEAEISDWETRTTSKAKKEMKQLEEELEKKISKAMQKMQMRIMETQRKAEEKKCLARQEAVKKMTKVEKACDKVGSVGSLPWRVMFMFNRI